jgi:thiol-disulfide isomerase/thioredoxin
MKSKILLLGLAIIMAAACTSKVGDTTTLIGKFQNKIPDQVHITIPDIAYDTLLTVQNKTFKIKVPTKLTAIGTIEYADNSAKFIPDGTTLTFAFDDEAGCVITSDKPKISAQARLNEYDDWNKKFMDDYNAHQKGLKDSTALTQEVRDSLMELYSDKAMKEYTDYNMEVLKNNKNNYLTLVALQNVAYDMPDHQLDSLFNTLDTTVTNNKFVVKMKKSMSARALTAVGKKFKDFTVIQAPGDTVKFSKYVGTGKYMLVDFWASWCGPCKREIPNVKAVYNKYHGENFDVLSVAVWDQPMASRDTAAHYGVNWNQIINAQQIPTDIYGIDGIPHIILFGPDGVILKRDLRGEDIEKTVAQYVAKDEAAPAKEAPAKTK